MKGGWVSSRWSSMEEVVDQNGKGKEVAKIPADVGEGDVLVRLCYLGGEVKLNIMLFLFGEG